MTICSNRVAQLGNPAFISQFCTDCKLTSHWLCALCKAGRLVRWRL